MHIDSGRCDDRSTAPPSSQRRRESHSGCTWPCASGRPPPSGNFNRAGDAVQLVVRALVFLLGGHYVDDFNAVDFGDLADSAFDTFGGLFGDLGLQTKPSKAQPPARDQVIQGVSVRLGDKGVTVQPTQRRIAKLRAMIQEVLDTGVLDPTAA